MTKEATNKRGQQMTLGTIIMIVLGITVLVFLIYGFSTGWGNLWQRITGLGGGEVNVDTIQTACTLACQTGTTDNNAYCYQVRTVNYGGGVWEKGSCETLEGSTQIAIKNCPSITCTREVPTLERSS